MPIYINIMGSFCEEFDNVFKNVEYVLEHLKEHPDDDVILYYPQEAHIIININGEFLFESIHKFMSLHSIKNFTYVTGNFKCNEAYELWRSEYNVTDDKFKIIIDNCFIYASVDDNVPSFHRIRRKYKYICLNNTGPPFRVELINRMYDRNLLDSGLYSFHQYGSGMHKDLYDKMPMIVDNPKLVNNHKANQNHIYTSSYFSIIPESVFARPSHLSVNNIKPYESWWREGFITEKIFKAFFYLHPFILVGASGGLEHVKSIGFKTFDGFMNESYDKEHDGDKRMDLIMIEIERLCNMSLPELRRWYNYMSDILLYNQNHIIKLGNTR